MPLPSNPTQFEVSRVTPKQIRSALSWQFLRLQFCETSLRDAVAKFNCNGAEDGRPKLVLSAPELGDLRVGGTFRVDNVNGFVRLLKVTMKIRGETRGEHEIVLVQER